MERVLIVDDDRINLKNLRSIVRKQGYLVDTAAGGEEAFRKMEGRAYDLVLTDLVMKPVDGLAVLARAKRKDPRVQVIVMTGYASVTTAVEAMKRGAFHYVQKPFHPDEVRRVVSLAMEKRRLEGSERQASRRSGSEDGVARILGRSPKMVAVRELIRQIAGTEANVLITGASGTGKELVAKAIHQESRRAGKMFLPINCASLAEDLVANELFGHEKEAYTGAVSTRRGLLEAADGGTVFFDEVGDMSPIMQAKLLRVVQERELIRVGGVKPIRIDVRIISATNKDLKRAMRHGAFREDLYYRLNVVPIELPSLHERKEDIPLLAKHFLERFNARSGTRFLGFTTDALQLLTQYDYPGNVRELENIIERAAALSQTEVIGADVLPDDLKELNILSVDADTSHIKTLAEVEAEYIREVLARCGHNKTRAAEVLGINRVSVYRKLKKTQLRE